MAGPPWNLTTDVNQQTGTQADREADFDEVCDDLAAGKDVEVRIPGHAACITSCVKVTVGGQTLPSPYYIYDDVQYFPPGPEFKLSREAAAMKAFSEDGPAATP